MLNRLFMVKSTYQRSGKVEQTKLFLTDIFNYFAG